MRMQSFVLAVAASAVLSVACVTSVAGLEFTIDELWFPGGPDSRWVYDTPDGGQITVAVVGGRDIGGKRYKDVRESVPFIGAFAETDPDPFLVFRAEDTYIRGYGATANGVFQEGFQEALAQAGWLDRNPKLRFSDDEEWNVVDLSDDEWTVMRVDAEAFAWGMKMRSSFEIQGRLISVVEVETDAGIFEALLVDYVHITEIEGNIERARFWTMWLSPGVGLVQLETGQGIATLAEYDITPDTVWTQQKAVRASNRLLTTWAHLKRML